MTIPLEPMTSTSLTLRRQKFVEDYVETGAGGDQTGVGDAVRGGAVAFELPAGGSGGAVAGLEHMADLIAPSRVLMFQVKATRSRQ